MKGATASKGRRVPPPRLMRGDDYVIVSLRLPTPLVKQLDRLAVKEERTRAKMIEIATRKYVEGAAA